MKILRQWHFLLLSTLLLPMIGNAQQYNHIYDFYTQHESSRHLSAVQITNDKIVAGSTIESPTGSNQVVQLSVVDPITGQTTLAPFVYSAPGQVTKAVDLIESTNDPDWVITVANFELFPGGPIAIAVFKTDPSSGAVQWMRYYGNSNYSHTAAAMTKDPYGNYYILGERDDASGNKIMCLLAIDDNGNPVWQFMYGDPNNNFTFDCADLLYDDEAAVVVTVSNVNDGSPQGALFSEIDASSGSLLQTVWVPVIGPTEDFVVEDMIRVNNNGNYAAVGHLNTSPKEGFLLQFQPGLSPHSQFSQIYTLGGTVDLSLTGINEANWGDLYASIEYEKPGNAPFPGMLEMDPDGNPLSVYLHIVKEYVESDGLIHAFDNKVFIHKGSTGFNAGAPETMSLISTRAPLFSDPVICPEEIGVEVYEDAKLEEYELYEEEIKEPRKTDIEVWDHHGDIFDCYGNFVNNFRLTAPTGIEEAADRGIAIYPNPSTGLFTLEISEEDAALYEVAEVYNALGEVVMTFAVNNTTERIDLSGEVPGIYMLRMRSTDGTVSNAERILIK